MIPNIFINRDFLIDNTKVFNSNGFIVSNDTSVRTQDKFVSSNFGHLGILGNNPELARLVGKDTPMSADEAYKFFTSFDENNMREFLATSSADDAKSLVASINDYLVAYLTSSNSYTVTVDGRSTAYKHTVPMGNPLAASIASIESGNPASEFAFSFIQTFNALLTDSTLTAEGGILSHLAAEQPAIIQELSNLSNRLENFTEIRNSSISLAQQQRKDLSNISKSVIGNAGGNGQ